MMELSSIPNIVFKTMLKSSGSVNEDGNVIDDNKFVELMETCKEDGLRPPKTDRTNLNYSVDLNDVLREIKLLTTDKTTGKKKVFTCGNIINTNVRNPNKLKEYQETQKKKKTSK
tara:strand:- start:46 stop:390 length:345 start_codon:yes stop_codon:yes gene_type:complete